MNDVSGTNAVPPSTVRVSAVARDVTVSLTWDGPRIAGVSTDSADAARARAVRAIQIGLENGRSLADQALQVLAVQEIIASLIMVEQRQRTPGAGDSAESDVLRDVLLYVGNLPDALFYRNNSGALPTLSGRWVSFGLTGSGDVQGCYRGRAVSIETKSSAGEQRQSQVRFQSAWERAGGLYILARSVADVRAAIA